MHHNLQEVTKKSYTYYQVSKIENEHHNSTRKSEKIFRHWSLSDTKHRVAILWKMVNAYSLHSCREPSHPLQHHRQSNSRHIAENVDRNIEKPGNRRIGKKKSLCRSPAESGILTYRPRHKSHAPSRKPHTLGSWKLPNHFPKPKIQITQITRETT